MNAHCNLQDKTRERPPLVVVTYNHEIAKKATITGE